MKIKFGDNNIINTISHNNETENPSFVIIHTRDKSTSDNKSLSNAAAHHSVDY